MQSKTAIVDDIFAATRAPEFHEYLTQQVVEICNIDTTPNADIRAMRDAESAVIDILKRELRKTSFGDCRCERRPINPGIASHPAYSQLHFTKTLSRPDGLSPEEAYDGRSNLLFIVPGVAGERRSAGVAVNAHIDVVHPYFPPRVESGIVYGRGACDDKGAVVAMLGAFGVLSRALANAGARLEKNLIGMFVVEEETGGNGSLSLALDRDLRTLYDTMVVMEITDNKLHPANRGAVWYRADLSLPDASLFEMSAFVVEEFEKEGRAIKAESRHALFPQRPVQTCHGIIGPNGEHPSRINGEVSFDICVEGVGGEKLQALV